MKIKEHIGAALSQELDRKEFFAYVGAVLLSLVGVSSILKAISGSIHNDKNIPAVKQKSYSGGSYGGR